MESADIRKNKVWNTTALTLCKGFRKFDERKCNLILSNGNRWSLCAYVLLLGACEIGLWRKRVLISGFLCVLLFLSCSLLPASPGLALLYLAVHRGLLENLKGFWNQTSGETRIQKHFFFFYKTGTEEKENPQTEMREFHKLPFVTK